MLSDCSRNRGHGAAAEAISSGRPEKPPFLPPCSLRLYSGTVRPLTRPYPGRDRHPIGQPPPPLSRPIGGGGPGSWCSVSLTRAAGDIFIPPLSLDHRRAHFIAATLHLNAARRSCSAAVGLGVGRRALIGTAPYQHQGASSSTAPAQHQCSGAEADRRSAAAQLTDVRQPDMESVWRVVPANGLACDRPSYRAPPHCHRRRRRLLVNNTAAPRHGGTRSIRSAPRGALTHIHCHWRYQQAVLYSYAACDTGPTAAPTGRRHELPPLPLLPPGRPGNHCGGRRNGGCITQDGVQRPGLWHVLCIRYTEGTVG